MLRSILLGAALALGLAAMTAEAEEPAVKDPEPVEREALVEETSVGEAITETAAPGWHYPKAYASRPLTMNKYMIRGTMLVDVKRAVPDNTSGKATGAPLVSLDFGAAFSIFDNVERARPACVAACSKVQPRALRNSRTRAPRSTGGTVWAAPSSRAIWIMDLAASSLMFHSIERPREPCNAPPHPVAKIYDICL